MLGWFVTLLAAALHVAAWLFPGSPQSAVLGWSAIALFVPALILPTRRLKRFFVAGCINYVGGFYWLFWTIKDFGGFPLAAALPIFLLFVCGSAVQFVMWAFTFQHLPTWCARWGMRTALSWLVAYHFWIKIFPWDFGHTQIAFLPFAQLAGLTGVTGITFLMMWFVETLSARKTTSLFAKITAVVTLAATLIYGKTQEVSFSGANQGTPLKTFLIQGNISLHRKHDLHYFTVNREQYLKISSQVAEKDALVVWPESTITDFLPASVREARTASLLPFLNNGSAFLVGALTFSSQKEYHNSSILIRPDGSVAEPYHKMILMPFGEYTPFASVLPFLKDINSTAGQFTPGPTTSVLSFPLSDGTEAKVSPLICYEDIVPDIAREAANKGAQVLVNQTNDAWFGDTVAPYQHHLIASFRAIETDRYLLRSTNSGLTAVVDPLGRTLASLLPYTEGVLPMEISLRTTKTFFTSYPISFTWFLLSAGLVISVLRRALVRQ